ncbi:hypothetical protein [Agrobacterium sp. CG674]
MGTAHSYVNLDDNRNLFSFVCPIFEVTTKISLCFKLRELHWAGNSPEVRKGCQACMRAGKCPAAAIVSKKWPTGRKWQDEYASDTPVVGKIRKDILERIHRPMVMERTMNDFGCSDAERMKIATASDRIGKMIGAAPLPDDDIPSYAERIENSGQPAPKKRRASTKSPTKHTAAATGDLAAAISA